MKTMFAVIIAGFLFLVAPLVRADEEVAPPSDEVVNAEVQEGEVTNSEENGDVPAEEEEHYRHEGADRVIKQ